MKTVWITLLVLLVTAGVVGIWYPEIHKWRYERLETDLWNFETKWDTDPSPASWGHPDPIKAQKFCSDPERIELVKRISEDDSNYGVSLSPEMTLLERHITGKDYAGCKDSF